MGPQVSHTFRNAAVEKNGVSMGRDDISFCIKLNLQIAQVFAKGIGLDHGNLPSVIGGDYERVVPRRHLFGGWGA